MISLSVNVIRNKLDTDGFASYSLSLLQIFNASITHSHLVAENKNFCEKMKSGLTLVVCAAS